MIQKHLTKKFKHSENTLENFPKTAQNNLTSTPKKGLKIVACSSPSIIENHLQTLWNFKEHPVKKFPLTLC